MCFWACLWKPAWAICGRCHRAAKCNKHNELCHCWFACSQWCCHVGACATRQRVFFFRCYESGARRRSSSAKPSWQSIWYLLAVVLLSAFFLSRCSESGARRRSSSAQPSGQSFWCSVTVAGAARQRSRRRSLWCSRAVRPSVCFASSRSLALAGTARQRNRRGSQSGARGPLPFCRFFLRCSESGARRCSSSAKPSGQSL